MDRETKLRSIAHELELLISAQLEAYKIPDKEYALFVKGRLDLLTLAEWVLRRLT